MRIRSLLDFGKVYGFCSWQIGFIKQVHCTFTFCFSVCLFLSWEMCLSYIVKPLLSLYRASTPLLTMKRTTRTLSICATLDMCLLCTQMMLLWIQVYWMGNWFMLGFACKLGAIFPVSKFCADFIPYKSPSDETMNQGYPLPKFVCMYIKDPVVHVRSQWIMETLKYLASTTDWVAQLSQLAFPGKNDLNFLWDKSQQNKKIVRKKNPFYLFCMLLFV